MPTIDQTAPSAYEAAYIRMLPAMSAIPESALGPITLDIPTVAATAIGVESKLRPYRDDIAKLSAFQDVACFDDLEDAARALMHAHIVYQLASNPSAYFGELADKAQGLRATLYSDAIALVNRGRLGEAELARYRGTVGYKIVATDLALLASVLGRAWTKIEGATAITRGDIDDANDVSNALLTSVGIRDATPVVAAEAVRMRTRAYALLLRYYDEVRRAMLYIRANEGDADALIPSLYANRGNGNHKKRATDGGEAPTTRTPTTSKVSAMSDSPEDEPFSA